MRFRALAAIAVMLVCYLHPARSNAASPGVPEIQRLIDRGMSLYDSADYAGAASAWESALGISNGTVASAEVLASLNLAMAYIRLSDAARAEASISRAAEHSKAMPDPEGFARVHRELGGLYMKSGEYEKAVYHFGRSVEYYREASNTRGQGAALTEMAVAMLKSGDSERARAAFERARELARMDGDTLNVANHTVNLAVILIRDGDYDEALSYLDDALKTYEGLDDYAGKTSCMLNRAIVLVKLGRYGDAGSAYEDLIRLGTKVRDISLVRKSRIGWAEAFEASGDLEGAIWQRSDAMSLARNTGDRYGRAGDAAELGRLFEKSGQAARAADSYLESYRLFMSTGEAEAAFASAMNAGRILSASGKLADAVKAYTRAIELDLPDSAKKDAYSALAESYGAMGDRTHAEEFQSRARAASNQKDPPR